MNKERSKQHLPVDHQLEGKAEPLRRLAAKEHAAKEDLKIIHHRAVLGVDGHFKGDGILCIVDDGVCAAHGVVHTVVDIELCRILLPYTGEAHIGFIRNDERRRNGVHGLCGVFVVVADGGDDGGDILRIRTEAVEDAECHDGAGLRMVDAVDDVADIVQIPGDLGKLRLSFAVPEGEKNIACGLRHTPHVGKAVLRVAHIGKGFIRPLNVSADGGIGFYLFKCDHGYLLRDKGSAQHDGHGVFFHLTDGFFHINGGEAAVFVKDAALHHGQANIPARCRIGSGGNGIVHRA